MTQNRSKPLILVIGSMNMDLVARLNRFPAVNETVMGLDYSYVAGGKGGNQAVAAARLGAQVAMFGAVGKDVNGRELVDGLAHEGIDVSAVKARHDSSSGLAIIPVDSSGNNQIMVMAGANMTLNEEEAVHAIESIRPDAIMLQLEIPASVVQASIACAKRMNILSVLDAGPVIDVPVSVFRGVTVLSPNESETLGWTGVEVTEERSAAEAVRLLRAETGAPIIVLKLGASGAYLDDSESGQVIPAFKVQAVDSTAAGDCFTAALTVRFLQTGEWSDSVRFAHAAAGITVSREGAQISLPALNEVQAYLDTRV